MIKLKRKWHDGRHISTMMVRIDDLRKLHFLKNVFNCESIPEILSMILNDKELFERLCSKYPEKAFSLPIKSEKQFVLEHSDNVKQVRIPIPNGWLSFQKKRSKR